MGVTMQASRRATPLAMTQFRVSVRSGTVYPIVLLTFKQLRLMNTVRRAKICLPSISQFRQDILPMLFLLGSLTEQQLAINMTSTDLRKRLFSLRNMSEQLRNSTQTPSLNLAHIRSLISNLKDLSESHLESSDPPPLSPHLEAAFSGSPKDERNLLLKPKRDTQQSQSQSDQQEIIAVREQNLRLEEQLLLLRSQLTKRSRKDEAMAEPNSSQSKPPYFRQSEDLSIFVCRFEISEEDYDKIQFRSESISLQLDRLVVIRKQKGSSEQFDLSTLRGVDYLPFHVVLYRFEEFEVPQAQRQERRRQTTRLFVKYDSPEQLKKWDLSMYINFQLLVSLQSPRHFETYFNLLQVQRTKEQRQSMLAKVKVNPQLTTAEQKWLLQQLRSKRQAFIEIRDLIQQKMNLPKDAPTIANDELFYTDSVPTQSLKPTSFGKPYDLGPSNGNQLAVEGPKEETQIPEHQYQGKGLAERGQTEFPQTRFHAISFSKKKELEEDHFDNPDSKVVNHRKKSRERPVPTFPQTATSDYLYSNNNSAIRLAEEETRLKRSDSQPQAAKRLSVVQSRIAAARKSLQAGYLATKYSKDGFSPHEKKVFLSLDWKKLCWSQKDKQSEYKSIPLEVIIKVSYGIIGEGIAKHVKKFDPVDYCVIEYYSGEYKKKTIQLKGESPQDTKDFCENLKIILDYSKGVSLDALVE